MSRYRLIALDIDGTLLTTARTIGKRTRLALDEVRARGVRLALVTGRRCPSARLVAAELGGAFDLVCHNGALILEDGAIVRSLPLAPGLAGTAIRIGREAGAEAVLHVGVQGEGRIVAQTTSVPHGYLVSYYLERAPEEIEFVANLEDMAGRENPMQVMFGGPRREIVPLVHALRAGLGEAVRIEMMTYGEGVALVEVLDVRVGKAAAVAFLQSRLGLEAKQTLAIGDNWNDREMLERAGRGLLMGNADPELQRLGFELLPSNDEEGVAVALERHVLGAEASSTFP